MVISEGMDQFAAHRLGDAGSIADLLYECYASKASMDNETIRDSFYVVEKCTEGMPYELSDRISAAMVSACVECERLAFLDGVALGVKLISELTK